MVRQPLADLYAGTLGLSAASGYAYRGPTRLCRAISFIDQFPIN